jgi:hypothetical protein
MLDRPLFELGNTELLQFGRQALKKDDSIALKAGVDELERRSSKAATNALTELVQATEKKSARRSAPRPKKKNALDAPAPCLYAIKLKKNSKNAAFYVGMSAAHSAQCKTAIHIRGECICGAIDSPNRYQRSAVPQKYGVGLAHCRSMSDDIDRDSLEEEEEAWAQDLAMRLGVGVWCNGRLFTK